MKLPQDLEPSLWIAPGTPKIAVSGRKHEGALSFKESEMMLQKANLKRKQNGHS